MLLLIFCHLVVEHEEVYLFLVLAKKGLFAPVSNMHCANMGRSDRML